MFTLGIPYYDDWDSFAPSLVANLQHPLAAGAVVVDNNPHSPQGRLAAGLCLSLGVKYVPMADPVGTAAAKNRVVQECPPGRVVVMDSHVVLVNGSLEALARHYDGHPDTDLVQGPIMLDDLKNYWSHLDTVWTPERAAGEVERLRVGNHPPERWADVAAGGPQWSEGMWGQWGTDRRADGAEAFDIPSHGMGMFATTRESWLGFHPDMRGFGGEETAIHLKYRKHGRRTLCVPGFRWWHRFARGHAIPHRVMIRDKFRNYLLGLREAGHPTDACEAHFKNWLPKAEWEEVMDGRYDPSAVRPLPAATQQAEGCSGCKGSGRPPMLTMTDLDAATGLAARTPSDINEHVPTLRDMAAQCNRVADVGSRVASALALAHAKEYHHFGTLPVTDRAAVHQYRGESVVVAAVQLLPEYELVFIDTDPHDADVVYAQLERFGRKATRWVVLHDTVPFGETGSSGGPGILPAVRRWVGDNPQWTVARHDRNNNGLLVLSCREADKKPLPPMWQQGWNVLKASFKAGVNVLNELGPLLGTETQAKRLALCTLCPSLNNGKCAECGCAVDKKTTWPTEHCPLGNWPAEAKPA